MRLLLAIRFRKTLYFLVFLASQTVSSLFLILLCRFGNTAYLHISVAFIQMLKALSM